VFATAIGRYMIRDEGPNANQANRNTKREQLGARTLANSSPKDWSWPCVLVFVSHWFTPDEIKNDPDLAQELVPSFLFLPDGRVLPPRVAEVSPARMAPAAPPQPTFKSDLVGGGYPIVADVQGKRHVGSIGCLVTNGSEVFALTNGHVAGDMGRE